MSRTIESHIIGLSDLNVDGTERAEVLRTCRIGDSMSLVRDARNRFSRTAVRVLTPRGQQVGYVCETASAQIAPIMDKGRSPRARLISFTDGAYDDHSLSASIEIDVAGDDIAPVAVPIKQAAHLGVEYQELLEAAMLDGHIDEDEDFETRVYASGLSEEVKRTVHARIYMNTLADVLQDDVVTDEECGRLKWVRGVLEKLGWAP